MFTFSIIIEQVAQLWQTDRASSINDFKEWVNFRLNYRLKGYVSRHYAIYAYLMISMFTSPIARFGHDQISHFAAPKDANSVSLT